MENTITQKQLKDEFKYIDGMLLWRRDTRNRLRKKGDVAGYVRGIGYRVVVVKRIPYFVHRLIFLYHYGYLPEYIDHIDGNKENNDISNLRECTRSQNGYNSKIPKHNTSGVKGVSWCKVSRKWTAKIKLNGKCVYLGSFWDKDVAAQIVRIERLRLHGEFANNG